MIKLTTEQILKIDNAQNYHDAYYVDVLLKNGEIKYGLIAREKMALEPSSKCNKRDYTFKEDDIVDIRPSLNSIKKMIDPWDRKQKIYFTASLLITHYSLLIILYFLLLTIIDPIDGGAFFHIGKKNQIFGVIDFGLFRLGPIITGVILLIKSKKYKIYVIPFYIVFLLLTIIKIKFNS